MISGFPFGDEPISGLRDVDDTSVGDPLSDLLSDPQAQLAFVFRGMPYDRTICAERPVYLSSDGYASLDDGGGDLDGIPDHAHFPASLGNAYNVKVNLLNGGAWSASAVPGFGAIVIANPTGEHDDLLKLDWELRQIIVWVGRKQWIGPSFKRLAKVFVGTVEALTWDALQISLNIRDLRQLFDQG